MIDRSLMHRTLKALETVDRLGMRENILLDEIALDAGRHVEASEIREHLSEAAHNLWAESYKGPLQETRWRITDAGKQIIRELRG